MHCGSKYRIVEVEFLKGDVHTINANQKYLSRFLLHEDQDLRIIRIELSWIELQIFK